MYEPATVVFTISDVAEQNYLSGFDCCQLFLFLCSGTRKNEKGRSVRLIQIT